MTESFHFFWSGLFSQWYPSPFVIDGIQYGCAEQYMMAEKARLFDDPVREKIIMETGSPALQQRFGRQVVGFDKAVWDAHAKPIVKRASMAKYQQNADCRAALFATGTKTLVEASPVDKIWGIGLRKDDKRAKKRSTWKGMNWLGQVLTEVRNELQAGFQQAR